MHESENARVEHRARRFDLWTCVVADIHAFSDQGMAELGQVDPNLMLPPCFEAAFDQGRARERSDRPHVRDRALRLGRNSAPGAPLSIPEGLSAPTTSRSRYAIALSGRAPGRSFGARSSTITTAPGGTRKAESRHRSPSTVTRPSLHRSRARDHAAPVCSRT